ncbi:MAG: hypothetical protein HPY50_14720 [Firmicutes bacterium]|nr:hypothetical protein [Bacillota bacterium]
MEISDVLGLEESEACSCLAQAGWKVKLETTQSVKPILAAGCRRVIRCRVLNDKEMELVVAPVPRESCPDWVP